MDINYKLPIDFSGLFESDVRNLSIQNEKDSIKQNLELIITTNPGEHKYNPKFGCEIWNLDFERVESKTLWEERFVQAVSKAVNLYEPRIHDVEVFVNFVDTKREEVATRATFIKTKANIRIIARMINTNERFSFVLSLFLGPLNPD